MLNSTIDASSSSALGKVPGDLWLRVVGAHKSSQPIQLRSAKCSIGSSANCTLRVKARGVDPVSCLVLRGTRGNVVRNWSGQTLLNGRAFADASLQIGDRLRCGTVEFEVIPGGTKVVSNNFSAHTANRLSAWEEETRHRLLELTHEQERLEAERRQLSAERESLLAEREGLQTREESLHEEQIAWHLRQESEQHGLNERARDLQAEQLAWTQQRQADLDALARSRAEQVESQRQAQHDTLNLDLSQMREQKVALERQLADALQAHDQQRATHEALRGQLQACETELRLRTHQFEEVTLTAAEQADEIRECESQLAVLKARFESASATLVQLRQELEQEKQRATAAQQDVCARDKELLQFVNHRGTLDVQRAQLDLDLKALANERENHLRGIEEEKSRSEIREAELAALLLQQNEDLEGRSREIEQRAQELTDRENRLTTREVELQDQAKLLEARSQGLSRQATEHLQQLQQAAGENHDLYSQREELAQRTRALDETQAALEQQRLALEEEQSTVADQQSALQLARQSFDKDRSEFAESVARQQQELTVEQGNFQEQQRTIDDLRLELERRQEADARARKEFELLVAERNQAFETRQAAAAEKERELEAAWHRLQTEQQRLEALESHLQVKEARTNTKPVPTAPATATVEANTTTDDEDAIFARLREMANGNSVDSHSATDHSDEDVSAGYPSGAADDEDVEVSDAYARFKQSMLEKASSEEPDGEAAEDAHTDSTSYASEPTEREVANPAESDTQEESIEDYMARLMQRVRGEAMPPAPRRERRVNPTVPVEPAIERRAIQPSVEEVQPETEREALVELVARAKAPEKDDISRMRDLANQQTRLAIAKSTRKKTITEATNRWFMSGVSAAIATGLAYLGWSGHRWAFLGSAAVLAITCYYAWQATKSARTLYETRKLNDDTKPRG